MIPKAELHVHLEGTAPPALIRRLAERHGVPVPDGVFADEHTFRWDGFLDFLHTADGQKIYAENGYRPVVPGVGGPTFPDPPQLFTIGDLGGRSKVNKELFDPSKSVMASIEQSLGISTSAKPSTSASK